MADVLRQSKTSRDEAKGLLGFFDRFCNGFFSRAWPSYVLIGAMQLKVIWDIWLLRDMSVGDTSAYFGGAVEWARSLHDSIVWSPLYTAFYGTVFKVTGDAYNATIWHRAIIVMLATIGCLAILRRLLPAALALLIACWWAILPINFETLYEVHLFALVPILAAWIIAASSDKPWARGTALAILIVTTVLVRNETMIAVLAYGVICVGGEVFYWNRNSKVSSWPITVSSYALPISVAVAILVFFYSRTGDERILNDMHGKHVVNMCQVYAFGYSQRHPDWTLSPWIDCQGLMQATFGQPLPTMSEMIVANPRAVFDHFLWNISLAPSGFEVSLFNSMTGHVNPDYAPVTTSWVALPLSILCLAIVFGGFLMLARDWRQWWLAWFEPRLGAWLIILATTCITIPVVLVERPRPSYMFSTALFLMAIIGTSVHLLTYRWPMMVKRVTIILAATLLVLIPSYYVTYPSRRPLREAYEALKNYAEDINKNGKIICLGDNSYPLMLYAIITGRQDAKDWNSKKPSIFGYEILSNWDSSKPLNKFLEAQNINFFFVQPRIFELLRDKPGAQDFLQRPETVGWRILRPSDNHDPEMFLLRSNDPGQSP